jgi:hypothetical protein
MHFFDCCRERCLPPQCASLHARKHVGNQLSTVGAKRLRKYRRRQVRAVEVFVRFWFVLGLAIPFCMRPPRKQVAERNLWFFTLACV